MPRAEFFARFPSLFVVEKFFDPELCQRLVSQVRAAAREPAVVRRGSDFVVDPNERSAKHVEVPDPAVSLVQSRLLALKPRLEKHFGQTLAGCQPPSFLAYGKGDFYHAHVDSTDDQAAPQRVKERQVSVVVFLNGEAESPRENCYGGGSLTLYGLIPDPRAALLGFPLVGEAGLLVAFRSSLAHEVKPVTHGERYTIATWFF